MRQLPDFIVIGAQKAGTTALRHALTQHPQIYLPSFPEPAFFSFEGGAPDFEGPQSPASRFGLIPTLEAYTDLFRGAGIGQVLGDISSHYSYCWPKRTAACMHHHVPNARLIAILRQPADRAYSAFNMMRQKGLEPLADFTDALTAEGSSQRANWTPDFFYRRNGMYFTNLDPYFRLFGSQQIRIFLYEEWAARPAQVLAEICRFLEIDNPPPVDLNKQHRESLQPRNATGQQMLRQSQNWLKPVRNVLPSGLKKRLRAWLWIHPAPLCPTVRQELTESYMQEIMKLQELIQQDLRSWLADGSERN